MREWCPIKCLSNLSAEKVIPMTIILLAAIILVIVARDFFKTPQNRLRNTEQSPPMKSKNHFSMLMRMYNINYIF